jgi:lipopolysaccharide heptosyltransferase I
MSSLPVQLDGARRVLLVKPSAIGDVVHALPVAATLRRRYPNIELDWLVEEEAADLVRGHPAISEVVVSGRRRWGRQLWPPRRLLATLGEVRALAAVLRGRRYDAVLDLQGLIKSALYVVTTRAPVRIGFAEGREGATWCLTHQVIAPPQPVHAVERYLALAAAVDATEAVRDFHIALGPEVAVETASRIARVPRPRVVLHPAARWRTKLWEPEKWQKVAATLRGEGCGLIVTGGRQDAAQVGAILRGLDPPPLSLVGRLTLKELAALLGEVELMITVDSGPMHVAAAMGTPVVALFGSTDPVRTGPVGPGTVLHHALPCSPCLHRRCRIPDTYRCMREITAGEVLAAARRLLRDRKVVA